MEQSAQQWQVRVLSEAWLSKIDVKASKRFSQKGLAEEAAAYVLDYLSADNWARCRQYSGKASIEGYLNRLVSNALEDFSRQRFSRPRPPTWLQRQGRFWVELWQRLCLERQLDQTVVDNFSAEGQRDAALVKEAISVIYARIPHCGEINMEIEAPDHLAEQAEALIEEGNTINKPTLRSNQEDSSALMGLMASLLVSPDDAEAKRRIEPHLKPLLQIKESLSLSAEQQLLLRLVYEDGLNLKQAANALGLAPHQPGRLLKQALVHIQHQFKAAGLSKEELWEALQ